jgi:dTDP-4-amino-4,6-dideoxy-D-galactose acyltransferase
MSLQQNLWGEDAFLGGILGYPVLRLRAPAAARHAIAEASARHRWMIEARVPVREIAVLGELTTQGFRIIDTNIQLTRAPGKLPASGVDACRMAEPKDESAVRAIAARSFSVTRFHLDPAIPESAANRIKEEWAGNFFAGRRGQWMVVAESAGQVCGFAQLLREGDHTLIIDLIAVEAGARNRGLAGAMIAYAQRACLPGEPTLKVGTQLANIDSLALYTRLGFRINAASHVLHRHGALEGS